MLTNILRHDLIYFALVLASDVAQPPPAFLLLDTRRRYSYSARYVHTQAQKDDGIGNAFLAEEEDDYGLVAWWMNDRRDEIQSADSSGTGLSFTSSTCERRGTCLCGLLRSLPRLSE